VTLRVHPDEIVEKSHSPLLAIHPSWERVRLSGIADVLNGFAFSSAYFDRANGVPLLRIRDVGRDETDTCYTGEYDCRYLVEPGSLVIGMDGDFRVARWHGPAALLNQRVCKVTVCDPELYDPQLLLYVLPGYLDAVHAHTSSVTVKHLSSRTVQELPLPLPPLNEQRRIVAAIEENLSRLEAADASLAAALRWLDAFVSQTVASALRGDWEVVPLREVTESQVYGTSVKASTDSSGVPVLRMGNINGGRLDLRELKYLPSDHPDVGKLSLQPGDLLFNRTNSPELVGKSAVFTANERMTFASYLIRVRLNEPCDPHWAALVINGPPGRRYIASVRSQQVGQANVNGTKLAALPLPLPPLEEQRRIVTEVEARLSVIDAMRDSIERAQRRSAALGAAILERAFRGELVPQDPADEPAEALLARIRAERAMSAGATGRRRRAVRP
jgi:type I restriction enzyme S subunit